MVKGLKEVWWCMGSEMWTWKRSEIVSERVETRYLRDAFGVYTSIQKIG